MKRHDLRADQMDFRTRRLSQRAIDDELTVNKAYEGAWLCIDDLLKLEKEAPTEHGRESAAHRLNLLRGQISPHNR